MSTYNPISVFSLPPQPKDPKPTPSTLSIDPFADIIWVGSSSGLVSAYCTPLTLTRNVQFPTQEGVGDVLTGLVFPTPPVREIRLRDREVWTLSEGAVAGRKRGGLPRWNVKDPQNSLRTMTPSPTNSHELLAGGTGRMMLINNSRGEVVRRFESPSPIVYLAPLPRTIISASLSGAVAILDPRTGFRPANNLQVHSHTGGLSGACAEGNIVGTWGWTHTHGHPTPDPMVKLYDVRTLRPLPPISFPAGPSFVLLNPADPAKIIISSQSGLIAITDTSTTTTEFQQLDVSYVTCMTMSPYGDYLAFGDADGQLHLWTSRDTGEGAKVDQNGSLVLPPLNGYEGVKPEWPDAEEPLPSILWDDRTPLNLIGMPHYEEPLLSNFSPSDYATVTSPFFNPPEPVPASVLSSMKVIDFVGYASLPRELRGKRNVVNARPGAGKLALGRGALGTRRESEPRFRSDKDRRTATVPEVEEETAIGEVPKYYRKVEIKYSKFGVEDFDFGYYNRTEYSGLETDILNSYTNALLQALHYTLPIRAIAKAHICVDCRKEHCLLCEAGFLFRMLEDAKGVNCHANNFSRAFSATPQASALGLMDDDKSTSPQGSLIQNFNRWLLSIFNIEAIVDGSSFRVRASVDDLETLSINPSQPSTSATAPASAISQVLGTAVKTTLNCSSCGHVSARESTLQAIDILYPRRPSELSSLTFPDLLCSSIIKDSNTKATCTNCKQFTYMENKRSLAKDTNSSFPPVMSINAMIASPEIAELWKDKTEGGGKMKCFLPRKIGFKVAEEDGKCVASEKDEGVVYEVRAIVVQVQTSSKHPAHLLSFVKMPPPEEGMDTETDSEPIWIMFNDFLVKRVKEEEVFSFPDQWKIPAVIILERVDSRDILDLSKLPVQLDHSVLLQDYSVAWHRRSALIKHTILEKSEIPTRGTLVAIDAEFVALQQEELEYRSDGTKKILRPSHMSLARVSVLRGEGEKEQVPFIDDYIRTTETIVDYLTEFSGIKAGDLDEKTSPFTLVPLKIAYKKLRLLVDLGCVFIGHGLSKDFRTINIYIPPEQVLDTVNLYVVPGRSRKLSLKFLTWLLLKKDIQTKEHDSIEDARHALLLYKLYREFEEDGRIDDVMEDIFEQGRRVGFKPPTERLPTASSGHENLQQPIPQASHASHLGIPGFMQQNQPRLNPQPFQPCHPSAPIIITNPVNDVSGSINGSNNGNSNGGNGVSHRTRRGGRAGQKHQTGSTTGAVVSAGLKASAKLWLPPGDEVGGGH